MATREVQRSFRLSADLDKRLEAKAQKLDRSVSWVIVRCLEVELFGKNRALTKAIARGAGRAKK